jgi:MFS transporter, CP family, cyanate transporter
MRAAPAFAGSPRLAGSSLVYVMLLWVAGVSLRLTLLTVPPLIRLIHNDLGLTEMDVGILSGLPPVLLGLAAVPGSLLIGHFGAIPVVIAGLLATAFGCALRGAAPDFMVLCAATALTGIGVAIMQPAMPSLVRAWLPERIGFGTAVYTNGLLVGDILPVAFTPLVLPLVGGSWRLAFVVWALPCIVFALAMLGLAPRPAVRAQLVARLRWAPDWRSGLIWRLGLMFGATNGTYFATNAFIPDYLQRLDRSDLIEPALSALNIGMLPGSILLIACAGWLVGRGWPYMGCGVLSLICILGITCGGGWIIVIAAGVLGFAIAACLTLTLMLPPLLSVPSDTHRMTAGMFTISYLCAVSVSILSGLCWDASAAAMAAFVPIALCNFLLIGLAPTIRIRPHASTQPVD